MKHHRRRHGHHRFGDHSSLSPGKVLRAHASIKDMSIGGLVGLGGGLGAIYGLNKLNAKRATQGKGALGFVVNGAGQTVPAAWLPFVPAVGGLAIGLAGYYATKRHKGKALAILGGSVLGGLIVSGFQFIKAKWSPQFGDYVRVRLSGYGNVLVNQGALGNLIVRHAGARRGRAGRPQGVGDGRAAHVGGESRGACIGGLSAGAHLAQANETARAEDRARAGQWRGR